MCRTRSTSSPSTSSFISLRHILPALPPFLDAGADIVALVKPQFEAGRDEVGKHGLVTDPAVHDAVIARVTEAAAACGLARVGDDAVADHRRDRQPGVLPAPPCRRLNRSIVLGAGAIGSVYAVKLAERHPVTVVGAARARRRDPSRRVCG